MKICSKCKKQLPIEQFNKCCNTKDGYQYYCKVCQREHRKNPTAMVVNQPISSNIFKVSNY